MSDKEDGQNMRKVYKLAQYVATSIFCNDARLRAEASVSLKTVTAWMQQIKRPFTTGLTNRDTINRAIDHYQNAESGHADDPNVKQL